MDSGHDDDSAVLDRIVFVPFFFHIYTYNLCGPRSVSEWHVSSIEIDGEQNKKKKKHQKLRTRPKVIKNKIHDAAVRALMPNYCFPRITYR